MPTRFLPAAPRPAVPPIVALLVVLIGAGFAQQPLTPPNYELASLPALNLGDSLDGRLEPGDGQNFKDGSYLDLYRLEGEADERIVVTLRSDTIDSLLLLYDATGALIGRDDDSGGDSDARLELSLPGDGSYLVVVTSFFDSSGDYTLTREDFAATLAGVERLKLGTTVEGVLEGEALRYRLDLADRTAFEAIVRSSDFDTTLRLLDAEGDEVAYDDDGLGEGTDSRLFEALEPGVYYLEVDGFGFTQGAFVLVTNVFR